MRRLALLPVCLLALHAGCDRTRDALVVRQQTSTTGLTDRRAESTQYWTKSAMVVDEPVNRIIVDFAAETLTSMDKLNKTYVVVSFDHLNAQMEGIRRNMEMDTAGLAPDVVLELERIGEPVGNRAAQVEVTATGKRETIAGYEAEEYVVKASALNGVVWVSREVALPLGEAEKKAYRKSMDGMQVPNMQFALAMLQLDAVPLRATLDYALGRQGQGSKSVNEVVEVRREAVEAELFAVPDDFSPMVSAAAPTMTMGPQLPHS